MANRIDELTVLTRMTLPILGLAKEENASVRFQVTGIGEYELFIYNEKDMYIHYWCPLDEKHRQKEDWNAESEGNVFMHVRTFESMKEILWTIREALS